MGLLRAHVLSSANHPLSQAELAAATFNSAPEFTKAMAASGQLQSGAMPPATMSPPQQQPQTFADVGFPWMQQNVLSQVLQYPQKRRSHTLGGGS